MTFCGTFDYLSPEMLENEPHDLGVDVWAAGVLVFEMLSGRPPFQASSQVVLVNRIVKVDFQVPSSFPPLAADLVKSLLKRHPKERVGLKDALKHPWICINVPAVPLDLSQSCSGISGMKNMEAALRKGEAKELQMDSPPRQKESGQPASEVVPSTISPASTVSVPQGYAEDARSQDSASSVSPASTVQVARPKPSVMPWSDAKTPMTFKGEASGGTPTRQEAVNDLAFRDGKDSRVASKESTSSRPAVESLKHESDPMAALKEMHIGSKADVLSQSYASPGTSKISMDPLSHSMSFMEDGRRITPQPKRKMGFSPQASSVAGDFVPNSSDDGISALHNDVDAMQQRLQRKLAALAEGGIAAG